MLTLPRTGLEVVETEPIFQLSFLYWMAPSSFKVFPTPSFFSNAFFQASIVVGSTKKVTLVLLWTTLLCFSKKRRASLFSCVSPLVCRWGLFRMNCKTLSTASVIAWNSLVVSSPLSLSFLSGCRWSRSLKAFLCSAKVGTLLLSSFRVSRYGLISAKSDIMRRGVFL